MDSEHSSTGTTAEQAGERIAANLTRWADDFWVRVQAADALVALCDPDGAVAHFETALRMAEEADDFQARADAVDRLTQISRRKARTDQDRPTERRLPGASRASRNASAALNAGTRR